MNYKNELNKYNFKKLNKIYKLINLKILIKKIKILIKK